MYDEKQFMTMTASHPMKSAPLRARFCVQG
jgi:hypothetical protein